MHCATAGGETTSYNVLKQYIRLSTSILQLRERQGIGSSEGRWELCTPLSEADWQFETEERIDFQWELQGDTYHEVEMAVLRCQDNFGYIAIPLTRSASGEYVRFASSGLKWLRTCELPKKPLQDVFVRALFPKSVTDYHMDVPRILLKSLPIDRWGYRICGSYPQNFLANPGKKSTCSETISRINKVLGEMADHIVFFKHDSPHYPPFAIRFDKRYRKGKVTHDFRCRVGSSSEEWEECPIQWILEENDGPVGTHAQFPLTQDESLFIRARKTVSSSFNGHFVNISIEPRIRWQQ